MQFDEPFRLLYTKRGDVVDEQYFGFAFLYENFSLIKSFGDTKGARYSLRSLAKPIQASTAIDFGIDLCDTELAIASGSHCGTKVHCAVVYSILSRAGLNESYLMCPPAVPLDTRDFESIPKAIYNNCSGKHALMLALCKKQGWDLKTYLNPLHPLQEYIYQKHLKLCGAKELPMSYDGCGAPVWALSLDEIARAFFNLFNNRKYTCIKKAIIDNPYIFGGDNRLDSEIVILGQGNLVSKVGAGGFVLIYNICENKILIVKICENNNPIRRVIALNALYQLGWINTPLVSDYFCNFSFS